MEEELMDPYFDCNRKGRRQPFLGALLRRKSAAFLGLFLLAGWHQGFAKTRFLEQHLYQETTPDSQQAIYWRLERDRDLVLTSTMPDEISVCRLDPQFQTLSWEVSRGAENTTLTATREGNQILIKGRLEGEDFQRTIDIDDAPWYQAGSLSLRALIQSDREEAVFWILRPGKYSAHKLRAKKTGTENLEINGVRISTDIVEVSLTGLLGALWSGKYWFRSQDGVLIRYRSPNGPPGSHETVIQWVPSTAG